MGLNNVGKSTCSYCGAQYRLFTIFNKDMQGLTKAWKSRHEYKCAKRTPKERLHWAKPYIGKSQLDSSITVDLEHSGFSTLTTYITTPGESIMGIALRQLGSEKRWQEIKCLNADKFPNILPHDYYPVGTTLIMPSKWE